MGDQVLIKTMNPQKKKMIMPDVMLYTKNVMIPVVKPVPSNQSFNISFFKPQILKAHNYKNNSAFLVSKTVSYNPLGNLLEVNRINCGKPKNQSTKYTISGKTDSPNIKKISILQNLYPLKELSNKKRNNTSYFPNIVFESLTSNKDLHKASSKSIKLSRKCNLSQMKESQLKYEDKFALVPRIETSMSESSMMSLSSQSFHDCTNTVSTVSTLSISNFKIENKKTFANIERKPVSQHLHPSNSECEISVLHYENDISGNCPNFFQSPLKSANTNLSSMDDFSLAKIQAKYKNVIDKKSTIKNQQEIDSTICDIKYSWEIGGWLPSPQRKKCDNTYKMRNIKIYNRKPYDCEIKYSWQVVGTSTQTSYTLLQNLLNNISREKPVYKLCSIKYSWQIIGTGTQTSLDDYDPDYWSGILLTPNKNYNENSPQIGNNKTDCTKLQDFAKYPEEKFKKYLMLNNQQTQTFAEKEIQANSIDCYKKYSWHKIIEGLDMERILKALTNQNLLDKSEKEQIDNREELLHQHVKPLMPNISSESSVIFNNGNENTRKEELLTRLAYNLKKLNQYEQNIDKNQATNVSLFNAEDTFAQKRETLPANVEANLKVIVESAQEYIAKLNYQLKDLDNADEQIENSMMRTLKDIDGTFQSLLDDVCHEINKRREQLILETEIHKQESLIPLRACRKEVEAQIQNAESIMSASENMLQHPQRYNASGFEKILAASNDIGRIPAVPFSEELPNINFDRPLNSCREEIIEQISKLGCISRTVPVQITSIDERPAGLFIKWHITNPEYTAEEQTFIVEKANGEILDPASNLFETVYKGSETSCFIRNMSVDQPVTLRVRIQGNNVARSVPHIARTSIPPYSWELDNKDYVITNNGKIAAKLTDTISTLFSQTAQFDANHIIEFKFLEVSQEGNDNEGIALVYNPQGSHDILKRVASLMITPRGKIFMDGEEKLMHLPRMRFGTDIMISAFRKNADVLRVNIESENKCVTYDWRVQTPLYFAARFTQYKKWNLMVK